MMDFVIKQKMSLPSAKAKGYEELNRLFIGALFDEYPT